MLGKKYQTETSRGKDVNDTHSAQISDNQGEVSFKHFTNPAEVFIEFSFILLTVTVPSPISKYFIF